MKCNFTHSAAPQSECGSEKGSGTTDKLKSWATIKWETHETHNQSKYWPQKCVRECLCAINAIKAKRVRECESYNVYKWLKWILSFGNFIRAIIIFDAFYSIDWYTSKTHAHTHTSYVRLVRFLWFILSTLWRVLYSCIHTATSIPPLHRKSE